VTREQMAARLQEAMLRDRGPLPSWKELSMFILAEAEQMSREGLLAGPARVAPVSHLIETGTLAKLFVNEEGRFAEIDRSNLGRGPLQVEVAWEAFDLRIGEQVVAECYLWSAEREEKSS